MSEPVPQSTLPANRLPNLRRRVNRARNFPTNTCPASRHLHMIADAIASGRPYHGCEWEQWDKEDREWIAGSLYSVLEGLWKARTKLAALEPKA
jgi:hypothetical protein